MSESLLAPADRPIIFGILNVTPDSFSDGGRWVDAGAAIARGRELVAQGASVIDIGGESTRPGAERVSAAEEQQRVLPVVSALSDLGIQVSVDTMRAATAAAAIAAGARIINDVSGGLADPGMAAVIAAHEVDFVAMHWRGHSNTMDEQANYGDVVSDVRAELENRLAALTASGIPLERIALDPGLGFAKLSQHNWQLLARLGELSELGRPLLIGASRKRFLGALLPADAPMTARDLPSAVVSALCAQQRVWALRVHDVASTRIALDVVEAWQAGARD